MQRLIIIVLIFATGFSQSTTQPSSSRWKEFLVKEFGFSVLLPYDYRPADLVTEHVIDGRNVSRHKITAGENHVIYLVIFGDVERIMSEKQLESFIEDSIMQMKRQSMSAKRISFNGYPGMEYKMQSSTDTVIGRVYVANQRQYQLQVAYPIGEPMPDTTYKFLDSFKFVSN